MATKKKGRKGGRKLPPHAKAPPSSVPRPKKRRIHIARTTRKRA